MTQKTVGQESYERLLNPVSQEIGETIGEMGSKYYEELENTINANKHLGDDFYIVVLRKKQSHLINVLRQWWIGRKTKPLAKTLRHDYPNYDHDVFHYVKGSVQYLWTLPTAQDAASMLKNPDSWDETSIKWIRDFNDGKLA